MTYIKDVTKCQLGIAMVTPMCNNGNNILLQLTVELQGVQRLPTLWIPNPRELLHARGRALV